MDARRNPFEDLYVSETVTPDEFVRLFSPFLIQHALRLFQTGNVVLRGVQGSGKTMLLSLLDPAIRVAYACADRDFPVPGDHQRFIAANINLRLSGASLFGQRPIEGTPDQDVAQFPLYFADFVNYWLVNDLLSTLQTYTDEAGGRIARELGLDLRAEKKHAFAAALAADPCWEGGLSQIGTYEGLRAAVAARLAGYRRFLGFNTDALPDGTRDTKTVIGEPVSAAARWLRDTGIIPHDVQVFAGIDQYEELAGIAEVRGDLAGRFQQVINRAIGRRDRHVSYRLGARRYAWRRDLRMFGTTARLEQDREYGDVDIDEILSRRENSRTYVFPQFAEDIVRRRLEHSGYPVARADGKVLRRIFGSRLTPVARAKMYVQEQKGAGCSPERIAGVTTGMPHAWREFLIGLASTSPYAARLAGAWSQQRGAAALKKAPPEPDADGKYEWDRREYWRKERREHALMQLAAVCRQRMVWAGAEDIIALSGGNTLILVSLCRKIWGAYLRSDHRTPTLGPSDGTPELPTITPEVQTIGIEEASRDWYDKTPEFRGGADRQRFLDVVARRLRTKLQRDRAMSNPGHNGFSLVTDELRSDPGLRSFLEDAVDYGDLVEVEHTTKEKDRRRRLKWYLKPVLSPYFSLPVVHTKEPMYVSVQEVRIWLSEAARVQGRPDGRPQSQLFAQLTLLDA